MAAAAKSLLDVLSPQQRESATAAFDTADHQDWTYLPGPRPGLPLQELSGVQLHRALDLVDIGLSHSGAATARDVMALDDVLRELERTSGRSGWQRRGSGQYWIRILGVPSVDTPWAWRLNGHHLAIHLTVVGEVVSGTPQFFGANPAVVPSGPHAGWQVLKPEESSARALLDSLDAGQRERAWVTTEAPHDILTRHDPVADPAKVPKGLPVSALRVEQHEHLTQLVRGYLDRLPRELADAAWAEVVDAGLERVTFAWAGGLDPGQGHYYALRGPTFLIEYDNVQNDANHAHTVWRDLRHDWGRDVLAEHYRTTPH